MKLNKPIFEIPKQTDDSEGLHELIHKLRFLSSNNSPYFGNEPTEYLLDESRYKFFILDEEPVTKVQNIPIKQVYGGVQYSHQIIQDPDLTWNERLHCALHGRGWTLALAKRYFRNNLDKVDPSQMPESIDKDPKKSDSYLTFKTFGQRTYATNGAQRVILGKFYIHHCCPDQDEFLGAENIVVSIDQARVQLALRVMELLENDCIFIAPPSGINFGKTSNKEAFMMRITWEGLELEFNVTDWENIYPVLNKPFNRLASNFIDLSKHNLKKANPTRDWQAFDENILSSLFSF